MPVPAEVADQVVHVMDPGIMAGLFALAMGLVKIVELSITTLAKKFSKDGNKPQIVSIKLDKELVEKIDDTNDKVRQLAMVMSRVDQDGTPMVYSSRTGMESIKEIAVIIRNVSQTQERLARVMERLEEKFAEHDKSDAAVYSQINMTLERMLSGFEDHDKRIMDVLNIQHDIKRSSKEIAEKLAHTPLPYRVDRED